MPKLARHYGEPFADPSAVPSFFLAELTSRHVTVALNGDGGDESFGGYERYRTADKAPYLNWLPALLRRRAPTIANLVGEGEEDSGIQTKVERGARLLAMSPEQRYAASVSTFDMVRRRRLLTPDFARYADPKRVDEFLTLPWLHSSADNRYDLMMATDVATYLPDALLTKMDIATMAYSVEARSPFLDHHLMEFAAGLPAEFKIDGRDQKRILKDALKDVLPAAVLNRPKMGFAVPIASWFRNELRDLPADVLLDQSALGRGYFRKSELESLIREHHRGAANHSLRLWVLLQLEMWHREVVEAKSVASQRRVHG
jgi:asparagine synthase (glutamine-hydrolysing)